VRHIEKAAPSRRVVQQLLLSLRTFIMTKIISASIVALAVLAGASSAMADQKLRDFSDPYGGYDHNSQEGIRAFWEEQSR
jgi:hypothetical protein